METENVCPDYSCPAGYHYVRGRLRPQMEYLAKYLDVAWTMRQVGSCNHGNPIVADATYTSGGDWWLLNDNGGEITLTRINGSETPISVPYEQFGFVVPIGRLAWFCRCVMAREEIPDYFASSVDNLTLSDFFP